MGGVDGLGFLAVALVLATFCMKHLVPPRAVAIASNVAFMCVATRPVSNRVWCSTLYYLPINAFRLLQALPVRLPDVLAELD